MFCPCLLNVRFHLGKLIVTVSVMGKLWTMTALFLWAESTARILSNKLTYFKIKTSSVPFL
jgi:hypothetical protein